MESAPVLTPHTPSGFTLVEMTVVIAIIGIITAIALTSQSTFNRSLVLTDTVYSIAFSAREAQSFGSGSRTFGSVHNAGYGIHLDRATPTSYLLFADAGKAVTPVAGCPLGTAGAPDAKPGDCWYTAGTADGIVQTYAFGHEFKINKFCGVSGGVRVCSTDSNPLTTLDITFTRPNTSATIAGKRADGTMAAYTCADLTIQDSSGVYTRPLSFSSLGEISVGQTCS